jgi:hypothetical protein
MMLHAERPERNDRIFRIALFLSLLVHLIVGFLVYESSADLRRVLARVVPHPKPQPSDEIVTLSSAIRLEKRAVAQPEPHSVKVAQRAPSRPVPKVVPHPLERPVPLALPRPVALRTPVPRPPPRLRHELAKLAPHAPAQPPKTTRAKLPSETPTVPPYPPEPEKVVAAVQQPEAVTRPVPERPGRPSRAAHFSEAQIEQIQSDLAKSIVADRAENNPLSNVRRPVALPASLHRSPIDFAALAGNMREAQGLCDPIRGWHDGGWDYYYATCTIEEPDGTIGRKAMPWPVRWRPVDDPWTGYNRIATGPMPLPPPGWRPDRPIDPDFIPYLRKNGYPI